MHISLITAVLNRVDSVAGAIVCVQNQDCNELDHVIIDGASTDGTIDAIMVALHRATKQLTFISEPDQGVYSAINKGVNIVNSDVVGLLHSDDVFATSNTIEKVMDVFTSDPNVDVVYGDLVIYDRKLQKQIRYWKSGEFRKGALLKGWMPPHPTLFVRRSVFENFGLYDTSFRVSADYDFVLRIFKEGTLKTRYIPEVLVHMRSGGLSSTRYLHIMREDYRAIKKNGIGGIYTLICKYARSASQFIRKHG